MEKGMGTRVLRSRPPELPSPKVIVLTEDPTDPPFPSHPTDPSHILTFTSNVLEVRASPVFRVHSVTFSGLPSTRCTPEPHPLVYLPTLLLRETRRGSLYDSRDHRTCYGGCTRRRSMEW